MSQQSSTAATMHAHVAELRRRLVWSVAAFGVGAGLGYIYRLSISNFLQRPLHAPLYYSSPAGSFNFMMQICLFCGVVTALPVVLFHIVRFIEPAFEKRLRWRHLGLLLLGSQLLAVAGCVFAYYIVVPMSLHFFAGFNTPTIHPLIQASDYFSYLIKCLISFAIIFQLPLLMYFINFITPMKPQRLLHYERHVIVASLIIAVLLPFTYDPVTQFIIAVPIIVLYNLSIAAVWLANRGQRRQSRRRSAAQTARSAAAAAQSHSVAPVPQPARPSAVPQPEFFVSPYVIDLSAFRASDSQQT